MKNNYLMCKYLTVLFTISLSEPVYAYIDPGTGSIILQGLLAAVAGAFVTIKIYWYKIKSFFTGSKSDEENEQNTPKN